MTSKKITRTRWRCDHCGRGGWQRRAMERHESGCGLNPTRKCAMHVFATGQETHPDVSALMAAATQNTERLREVADGCPACMIAGIRQALLVSEDPFAPIGVGFNFDVERRQMWENSNNEHMARECYQ